jgi:hypothetical protein
MIKVVCKSYKDDLRTKNWPTCLACKPEIGEIIMAGDRTTRAEILEICHDWRVDSEGHCDPYLVIVLTNDM